MLIGWIITAVVLGMLAYPILQIIPSAAQKRQMLLRQAAQQKGLRIQTRPPKLPDALASQYPQLMTCVGYCLPLTQATHATTTLAIRGHDTDTWLWLHEQPSSTQMAAQLHRYQALPTFILAVAQSPLGSTIFWQERGDVTLIDGVHNQLQQLNNLLV